MKTLRPFIVVSIAMFTIGCNDVPLESEVVSHTAEALMFGDAYANVFSNSCSWTMGTASVEKQVRFDSVTGTFTLSGFKNKLPATPIEYVQGTSSSDEFRFSWDANVYSGASSGWSCVSGNSSTVNVGGLLALQVDIVLSRRMVQVSKHYVIHPYEGLIREWTEYKNTDTAAHVLRNPSFLEQTLMANDISNVDFSYMTGADDKNAPRLPTYSVKTVQLNPGYARTFDSYDHFGIESTEPDPKSLPYAETSQNYMPWFSLFNRSNKHGMYAGFDYYGRWSAPIGNQNGKSISLSLAIPAYEKSLAPSETMTGPKAFVGVYKDDLDDMTNRLLDWQYRYLWDYTRAPYFTGLRFAGWWCGGSHWCQNWDQAGTLQKVFGLADHLRAIGADTYHRDNGWWDTPGNWNGPDWRLSHDYLAKMDMKQLIYYFAYSANNDSAIVATNGSWFANSSPCGYANKVADLSIPAAESWVRDLLVEKATVWGDYQWRNDACFIANVDGARQLAEDQAFRRIQQGFLDSAPGSAIQGVNSGGRSINYEYLRMASGFSFTDASGFDEHDGASRLFPTDKLSGIGDLWPIGNCSAKFNTLLMFNPEFAGDADATAVETTVECMRKLTDTYHYLAAQGVVGRWVRQYHPSGSDTDRNWFERLSADGNRGLIFYKGTGSTGTVTVFPKGLNANSVYDVRFQFTAGSFGRTGADLMANGIQFGSIAAGELVYLGLPKHPGSGVDTTSPTNPGNLTVRAGMNMNYPGVELRWNAATDDEWLSYYEVFRDGVSQGKVAKGTYFFDHSPGADPNASYSVRATDGNGNVSGMETARGQGSLSNFVDNAPGAGVRYVGSWAHDNVTYTDASYHTITATNVAGASAEYTFFGNQITWYGNLGVMSGIADVYIDGNLDVSLDLYAPDHGNWDIPVYSKSWAATSNHTIKIVVTGKKRAVSQGTYVHIDGFRVLATPPVVTEDSLGVTYSGDWTHGAYSKASNQTATSSRNANDSAQFTFAGNDIVWVSRLGANMGQADVYIDGVFDARIDTFWYRGTDVWQAPVYRKTWPNSGIHTIKVVVLGAKNFDSLDTQVFVDAFHVRSGFENFVNDSDPSLAYSGSWGAAGSGSQSYLNRDGHFCNSASCRVDFTFTGTAVQILGDRDTNHGYANVVLDGGVPQQIDAYGEGPSGGRQILFQRDGLANTSHTISVTVLGQHNSQANDSYITLDAFTYRTEVGNEGFFGNRLSGKCLDVSGAPGMENGTPVALYDCEQSGISGWGTVTDQKWELTSEGFFFNRLSGRCLDVQGEPGTANGTPIRLADCEVSGYSASGSTTDQKWDFTSDGFLRNRLSGKCLDVQGAPGTANGASIDLFDCETSGISQWGTPTDQKWGFLSTYQNPVIAADCPDPGAISVDSGFRLACTGGHFPTRTSTNLVSWTATGSSLLPVGGPSWAANAYRNWAPEIHRVGGKFVGYFTSVNAANVLSIGAVHADTVDGPYTDRGGPLVEHPDGAIDATFFEDDDGSRWLLFKVDGNACGQPTPILIRRLTEDGLALTAPSEVKPECGLPLMSPAEACNQPGCVLVNDPSSWEGGVVEAPWLVKHAGMYYLFYSANVYDARYRTGVARSSNLLGPYEKHSGPILANNERWVGPGHGSVVSVGTSDFFVYHAWKSGGKDQLGQDTVTPADGRQVLVDRIDWQDDGWPRIHDGTPSRTPQPVP